MYIHTHNTVFEINHTSNNNDRRSTNVTSPTLLFANQINCPGTENKALVPMRYAFPTDQFADGQEERERWINK